MVVAITVATLVLVIPALLFLQVWVKSWAFLDFRCRVGTRSQGHMAAPAGKGRSTSARRVARVSAVSIRVARRTAPARGYAVLGAAPPILSLWERFG